MQLVKLSLVILKCKRPLKKISEHSAEWDQIVGLSTSWCTTQLRFWPIYALRDAIPLFDLGTLAKLAFT